MATSDIKITMFYKNGKVRKKLQENTWKLMLTLTKSLCHDEPNSSPWCSNASTSSVLNDSW